MSTHHMDSGKRTTRQRLSLVVFLFTVLALAASPAALAAKRGGPGAPTIQATSGVYLPVIRTALLRLVSWSD
jgi:hypothetical protein